jgi:signal transduction histidine kinase
MSLKKMIKIPNTLLFRLTFLYAGIFTLSSILIFSFLYYKMYSVAIDEIDGDLRNDIGRYTEVMEKKGVEGVRTEMYDEAKREDPTEEFYRLLTLDGEVIASSDVSSWGAPERYSIPEGLRKGTEAHVFQTVSMPERETKARMITATIGPGTVLQLGETLEDAEEYLLLFRNWFLAALGMIMLLSGLIGWLMARRALGDMEEVTKAASEISQGAYDKRVEVRHRFEEIERLGGTFNAMLDRIENLLKSMREVNDNIAHDLRSPLARIRGIAEMSLMDERTAEEYRSMAASTIEECDTLIDMINTMLEITEADSGVNESYTEHVDIVPLIKNASELFRPVADIKHIGIALKLPETLSIDAERKKLQRVVSNLMDNAIKYTNDGGNVSISTVSNAKEVQIVVEDTGIGISEADLPHIFERFFRCDQSRSQGGSGLGLSLAGAFARSMKGFIHVESALNKGSRFTVHLPNHMSAMPT